MWCQLLLIVDLESHGILSSLENDPCEWPQILQTHLYLPSSHCICIKCYWFIWSRYDVIIRTGVLCCPHIIFVQLLPEHDYVTFGSLLSQICLSSVTFLQPTQGVETFSTISMPFCTLAILWPPCKILQIVPG